MHAGPRTRADRELLGQGAANVVSGLAGGLPVTGVILRSAANVAAGARTRAATVLHGVWIAVFGIALVGLVEQIPLAALAGLLVTVGAGLVRRADVASARSHGELPAYLATAAGVLVWGLLTGVGIGLAVAGLSVLARVLRCRIVLDEGRDGGPVRIAVGGVVSFLSVPRLDRVLAGVAPGADVRMDIGTYYLDHAAREHLDGWTARHRRDGGVVELHREPSAPRAAGLAPVVSAPAGRDPAPPVPSPVPTGPGRSCPAGRPDTAST
jgi:carbonic anhydrase